ncbi:hypothetical protein [Paenibacillus sp. Y412MC10]|uniref:hypothetical protein n=1 Tax=Geobacillus sp. (strain Y412MC10) TaxID=481743 RepID=UPI0016434CBE|nr:hypothetical protein [Paenibacillus sp. Y412MC10]
MTEKFILNYTDGDFTENIEIPIYKAYRKGTSFQLYHLNRNPALIERKELLVIDESGIAPECMFKSVTEFSETIIPYLLTRKNESLFLFGEYYDAEKDKMMDIDDIEIPCIIGGAVTLQEEEKK